MQRHAQRADALPAQAERRRQHQVGAIRFQQVGRADVGLESPGDQRDHVHQRFGGLAAFPGQRADFVQGEDVIVGGCFYQLRSFLGFLLRLERGRTGPPAQTVRKPDTGLELTEYHCYKVVGRASACRFVALYSSSGGIFPFMIRSVKIRNTRMYSARAARLSSRCPVCAGQRDSRKVSFPGALHALAPGILKRLELLRTASHW